jgi:recombination protein RecT
MSNALQIITGDIMGVKDTFNSIAQNTLSFEREAGFAIQLLMSNDYAMKIATQNRQSVINAVTNIAAIGISLNPAKKQAYLVPRDGRICLDISYMGLLDLAIQSGSLMWGQAELVYQQDSFMLNGFDKPPTHGRNPFSPDRGEIVGAYVVVKTKDGDYLTACMSIQEVYDIRNRSSAWKAWEKDKRKCPWVTDEGEMVKKTVIKRAYKTWPKTDRLDAAVHYLNTEGGEGLADMAANETYAKGPSVIKGTDGMLEAMSIEDQNYMRELAEEMKIEFTQENGPKLVFDKYTNQNFDNDQRVAFWSLLPSNIRSSIKAIGKKKEAA